MNLPSSGNLPHSVPAEADAKLKKLIILGAGGYAQEVLWLVDDINAHAPQWDFVGFLDPMAEKKKGDFHYDRPVLGGWNDVTSAHEIYFVCGIGSPGARAAECRDAEQRGYLPATLIHPSAVTALHVRVGEGTVVGAGCVLAPYAVLGRHCALNLGVIVGHNASVGDYCVLSPRSQLLGAASLADQVFLGANATVYLGRKIGAGSVIGANSFVLRSVGPNSSVIGVPAIRFSPAKSKNPSRSQSEQPRNSSGRPSA